MDLNFTIEKQTLKRTDNQQIVNWSNEYLVFNFQFSNEWSNLSKFLLIFCGDAAYRFAIEQNKFTVPYTLIKGNTFVFSVYGIDNEEYRITTNKIRLILGDSGFEKEIKTIGEEELTLDVVELIYTELDKKANASELPSLEVTLEEQTVAETGYCATYVIKQGGVALSPKINIPKDYLVKSASVETCTEKGVPLASLDVGDLYLDFVINTVEGTGNIQHLYIDVSDLTDVYTADEVTLTLVNGVFSIKDVPVNLISDLNTVVYTKEQVDDIINNLNNRVILKGDKTIIQTGDTTDFTAYAVKDGMPVINEKIYFYKED